MEVFGAEIHEPSAKAAVDRIASLGATATIAVGDFFELEADPTFDAVIGNPPYVRFHDFAGSARSRSIAAAFSAGVAISGLASSWAAFVVHSTQFLKTGGRMGMVLPSELLTVDYASAVRVFLLENFEEIRIVTFNEPVFPGVQTDVVLLLADGFGGLSTSISVAAPIALGELSGDLAYREWSPAAPGDKWSLARLGEEQLGAYERILEHSELSTLGDWGSPSIGVVTGNNKFFTLSAKVAQEKSLRLPDLVQLAPPMKPAKRGLSYTEGDWKEAIASDAPTWLFKPIAPLERASAMFIEEGEAAGVNLGYKCTHRSPWWEVPLGDPGDLVITYMSSEMVRIFSNPERMYQLNSLHRFELNEGVREIGKRLIGIASLNSLTLIGSELLGRAYGGGVLKLELKELKMLPMFSPQLLKRAETDLAAVTDEVDNLLRTGQALAASKIVDDILLKKRLKLSAGDLAILQSAHEKLRSERLERAKPYNA